jgi:hypothetical protein
VFKHFGKTGIVALKAAKRAVEEATNVNMGLVDEIVPTLGRWYIERLPIPAFEVGTFLCFELGFTACPLLCEYLFAALVEHVRTAFEEQHSEDVFFEF